MHSSQRLQSSHVFMAPEHGVHLCAVVLRKVNEYDYPGIPQISYFEHRMVYGDFIAQRISPEQVYHTSKVTH